MKLLFRNLCLFAGGVFLSSALHAQEEGFIYGKITTEDDRVYEGPIRWGKEEVYWNDMFNASKIENGNLRFLSDEDRETLDEKRNSSWFVLDDRFNLINWTRWHNDDDNYVHQFSCQFGELKSIRPTGRKYVELELRNGQRFEVSGDGYNDVGANIRIMDTELGEAEIRWDRISRVEFMRTPHKLEQKFGMPLYGTVEAFGDKFTGYIQWDHDERLTTDKLDGDSDDGDVAIEFGKIRSIERKGGRCLVTLRSGRGIMLGGSNDVGSGHRGVIVMNSEFPSIDIPWNEFDKIVFEEKAGNPVATYDQFASQKELKGKVTLQNGKFLTGKIVYDLDEAYDYELLQGKEGEFEYVTPFRNVKRITTLGTHRCSLELQNGKKIILDESQDVNERNQGILVFNNDKTRPVYIPWDDVKEIEF